MVEHRADADGSLIRGLSAPPVLGVGGTTGPWGRRTCPPRCRGRATAGPPRGSRPTTAGIEADEHVRRAAEVARHRGALGPTNMSAALPRSRDVSAALPRSSVTAEPPRGSRPMNMSAALPR